VFQPAENIGGLLSAVIQQYTTKYELDHVQYDFVDNFEDCTITLQDDNKQPQTLPAKHFFHMVATYLSTMKQRLEDVMNMITQFKVPIPSYIFTPEVNFKELIAFVSMLNDTTVYQQRLYSIMASDNIA